MTRAELEAYALELGWGLNKPTAHPAVTMFGRNGYGITVIWHHAYPDEVVAASVHEPDRSETWAGFGHAWLRKRLRELAGRYTPPASLLDTVAMAVDDEHPDLADLPPAKAEAPMAIDIGGVVYEVPRAEYREHARLWNAVSSALIAFCERHGYQRPVFSERQKVASAVWHELHPDSVFGQPKGGA